MKNTIRSLCALVAIGAFALTARAETPVKLLVVDVAKVYDSHYKTQEQNAKLEAAREQAKEYVDKMRAEGQALVDEYKNLQEQSSNAALTAEAKSKAQDAAQKKMGEIEAKQNEINSFVQNTQQSLQQRLNNFRSLLLEEITKSATEIAKRHGATLLFDKSGPSLIGVSNILYSDPSFDITDEVMKEINKDRPATAPAAAAPSASAPAASTPATSGAPSGPTINLPIAPKK